MFCCCVLCNVAVVVCFVNGQGVSVKGVFMSLFRKGDIKGEKNTCIPQGWIYVFNLNLIDSG